MSGPHPDDDRDESADDRPPEDDHWLSSLLSALQSLDRGPTSTSGRKRSDRTVFDYDISIRSGDDLSADSPFDSTHIDDRPRDRSLDRNSGRPRKRRIRPSSDHTVSTRTYDDEFVVSADIAGADPDDVTVGFDDSMLVIVVEGSELDRIEVPWRGTESRATIKNGVLTVQIRPEPADETTEETEEDP